MCVCVCVSAWRLRCQSPHPSLFPAPHSVMCKKEVDKEVVWWCSSLLLPYVKKKGWFLWWFVGLPLDFWFLLLSCTGIDVWIWWAVGSDTGVNVVYCMNHESHIWCVVVRILLLKFGGCPFFFFFFFFFTKLWKLQLAAAWISHLLCVHAKYLFILLLFVCFLSVCGR